MRLIINSITQPANVHKKFLPVMSITIFMTLPIPALMGGMLGINNEVEKSKIANHA